MNLVEIGSVVFKIQEVEIGKILVRVNNTLVLRATFLAARHTTVCLIYIYQLGTERCTQKAEPVGGTYLPIAKRTYI